MAQDFIHRRASGFRKTKVAQRGGICTMLHYEVVNRFVDVICRDPRLKQKKKKPIYYNNKNDKQQQKQTGKLITFKKRLIDCICGPVLVCLRTSMFPVQVCTLRAS
jgi:hypothetical protein